MTTHNLFDQIPTELAEELVDVLAKNSSVRIERIVSAGHRSEDGFWYEQSEHEWVVVLQGEAKLSLDDASEPIHLRPGDHIHLPAGKRHRVDWTSDNPPTVWLAVFYAADAAPPG